MLKDIREVIIRIPSDFSKGERMQMTLPGPSAKQVRPVRAELPCRRACKKKADVALLNQKVALVQQLGAQLDFVNENRTVMQVKEFRLLRQIAGVCLYLQAELSLEEVPLQGKSPVRKLVGKGRFPCLPWSEQKK